MGNIRNINQNSIKNPQFLIFRIEDFLLFVISDCTSPQKTSDCFSLLIMLTFNSCLVNDYDTKI